MTHTMTATPWAAAAVLAVAALTTGSTVSAQPCRAPASVYAFGTGATHRFFVIHATKPDIVVEGSAKDFDRQSFFDLI